MNEYHNEQKRIDDMGAGTCRYGQIVFLAIPMKV